MTAFGSGKNALSADRLAELVERVLAIDWPVGAAGAEALLKQWCWAIEECVDARSMVVDPGFGFDVLDPGWFKLDDGDDTDPELSQVVVAVSDRGEHVDAAARRDLFAAQVATTVDRCGPPAERTGGTKPVAVWLLASDSRLVLYGPTTGGGLLTVSSPTYGRLLRDTD